MFQAAQPTGVVGRTLPGGVCVDVLLLIISLNLLASKTPSLSVMADGRPTAGVKRGRASGPTAAAEDHPEHRKILRGKLDAARQRQAETAVAEALGQGEDGDSAGSVTGADKGEPETVVRDEGSEDALPKLIANLPTIKKKSLAVDALSMLTDKLCHEGESAPVNALLAAAAGLDPLFANQLRLTAQGQEVDAGLLGEDDASPSPLSAPIDLDNLGSKSIGHTGGDGAGAGAAADGDSPLESSSLTPLIYNDGLVGAATGEGTDRAMDTSPPALECFDVAGVS